MNTAAELIVAMPKAELHLHIEGTIEPEMMLALATRNGVALPYDSVEEVRAAYAFSSLQDFLDLYYRGMAVLHTEADFFELTSAYLTRARADNVTHAEIFFDPQGHTERGVPFETVVNGIHGALTQAADAWGLSFRLIMCFLRHLPEESAERTLDMALEHRDRIYGVGLDSSELGHPPAKFRTVFARARAAGFAAVAHAGEEGPADYVREALDVLAVARIDHGVRAVDDPALLDRLAREQVPLTVCPLSNLRLGVVGDLADHPLPRLVDHGLLVTVNSDDPAYFGGYVNENYLAIQRVADLSLDTIAALGRNSYRAAFLDAAEKDAAQAAFDRFVADFNAS